MVIRRKKSLTHLLLYSSGKEGKGERQREEKKDNENEIKDLSGWPYACGGRQAKQLYKHYHTN